MQESASITSDLTPLADAGDPTFFGQKAARLSRIRAIGLPVPDGWVIGSETFLTQLERSGIDQQLESLLAGLSGDSTSAEQVSNRISELICSWPLPVDFRQSLQPVFDRLSAAGAVVVRSSAIGEDGEQTAFAGLLDSILHVRSFETLCDAVRTCWASCWSHRSLAYQQSRNQKIHRMGTLIQEQVDATVAGVLFTRNPVAPASVQMVIEYSEGTAESLVSGSIVPRRLLIEREASRFEGCDLFPADAVQQLVDFGHQLERLFESPQDIEWCLDAEGQLWIVQSRPITTLGRPGQRASVVWSNANVNENFPDPICPLLYSVASEGYYHYFRNLGVAFGVASARIDAMESLFRTVIGTHGGRMYYNLSSIHGILRAVPFGEFLASAFNQFVGSESTERDQSLPQWETLQRGRAAESLEVVKIAWRAWRRFRSLERGIDRIETRVNDFARDCRPDQLRKLADTQDAAGLLSLWREFICIRQQWTDASMADASSMISYHLTHRLLEGQFEDDADQAVANRLLTGLCTLVSGLPTDQLWEISRQIRQIPRLAERFAADEPERLWQQLTEHSAWADIRQSIQQFIDEWGFRCSGELLLITPTYQDDPASLIPLLATFVARDGEPPWQHLERQKVKREQETERILKVLTKRRLFSRVPFIGRRRLVQRLIAWTQRSIACRERARLKQALLYTRMRALACSVGRVLVKQGLLEHSSGIFFLTWQETEQFLSGQTMMPGLLSKTAMLRREEWNSFHELSPPGLIKLPQGEFWKSSCDTEFKLSGVEQFEGTGVSAGTITGRAVVLRDPNEMNQVSDGDILVTQQTDPGWGPILFLVQGLVMERGGMLSHGAILAREYGIPTVVAIPGVTQRIRTGMQIRVDGDRGVVEIVEE